MPVTVNIPVTGDYREIVLPVGYADYVRCLLVVGDYLFLCTATTPAKLLKVRKDDFSLNWTVDFPNDLEHKDAIDAVYSSSMNRIYVLFANSPPTLFMIAEVNPNKTSNVAPTITNANFVREEDIAPGRAAMATDDANLYVLTWGVDPTRVVKVVLSTGQVTLGPQLTGSHPYGWVIKYDGGKLYAYGKTEAEFGDTWVKRINPATASLQVETGGSTAITNGTDFSIMAEDMGVSSSYLWVGRRGNPTVAGIIKKVDKSSFAVTDFATGINGPARIVRNAGSFIWGLYDNGKAVRITPANGTKAIYTLNDGQGFQSQINTDADAFLYTAWNQSGTKIARYRIPSDVVASWPVQGAGGGLDNSYAVAVDSSGNVVVTGLFQGSIEIAGGAAISSSPNPLGAFIAKLSSGGGLTWARPYELVTIKAMALDASGNIVVGGSFRGTVNLGGSDLVAATNSQDCFLAKFDAAGNHSWSTRITGGGTDDLIALVIDSLGNIIVAGSKGPTFTGFKVYGTDGNYQELLGGGGGLDTWLAKFNSAGVVLWPKQFPNAGDDFAIGLAVDGSNNIWLAGATSQLINVGSGMRGGGYLVQLDSDGNYLPGRDRQVGTNSLMQAMTRDAAGDIIITGTFIGTLNLGGADITGGVDQFNQPTVSAYVVKYRGTDLAWQWNTVIRGSSNGGQFLNARLVTDSLNTIWMSGFSQGNFTWDTTSVPGVASFGHRDGFLARLSSTGAVQRVTQFAGTGTDADVQPSAIAIDQSVPVAVPIVAGSFTTSATFAGTRLTSAGGADVFVGKFPSA